MEREKRTISSLLMQISLGCLFIISGIQIFRDGTGDAAAVAITKIFNGDLANILCYIFAVIELIAGTFLILRIFIPIGTNIDSLFMFIIMICWIIAIVLIDFINGIFKSHIDSFNTFLVWLRNFAYHLIVLAGVIRIKY